MTGIAEDIILTVSQKSP